MKDIKVLGVDLAKDVFQLHGTDAKGDGVLTKRLSRGKLIVMWFTGNEHSR
jgi:transposase